MALGCSGLMPFNISLFSVSLFFGLSHSRGISGYISYGRDPVDAVEWSICWRLVVELLCISRETLFLLEDLRRTGCACWCSPGPWALRVPPIGGIGCVPSDHSYSLFQVLFTAGGRVRLAWDNPSGSLVAVSRTSLFFSPSVKLFS